MLREREVMNTRLSVLDLVIYPEGKTIREAFHASRELALHAEKLGYTRYWMAEHHNLEGIASAATSILIGYIAENTSTIRVGSGGIMLPNHSPLVIAEQFGTLATLYPGRIDLGLGRAPGTDQVTMRALRRDSGMNGDDFAELIAELSYYFAPAEPGQKLKAIPGAGVDVPLYILGSSLYSARLSALLGRPYAFAGHFAPAMMHDAFAMYRREFRPSSVLEKPYVMVGVGVVAAPTDEEADYLATSLYQRFLSLIRGQLRRSEPPVKSMDGLWTRQEEDAVKSMMKTLIVGGPDKVRAGLESLQKSTGADEFVITSDLYEHSHRLRSYEIIAEAWKKGL
ncbi:MAG: LLM class flavin-dependent oxidoreductase [Cytophagaceae bacterium]|nr:MAG: LLM class flavin-dependent oxidoreductase [Cytophagaceae bacterium]